MRFRCLLWLICYGHLQQRTGKEHVPALPFSVTGESTPQTAGSFRKVCLNNNTSRTTNMTGWKNHHLKMFLHLLFKIRDFPPSHLSFRQGTYTFSMRTRGLGSQESHHLRCWSQACCIRNTRTSSGSWNFANDEDKCLRRSWFLAKSAGNLCFHPTSWGKILEKRRVENSSRVETSL